MSRCGARSRTQAANSPGTLLLPAAIKHTTRSRVSMMRRKSRSGHHCSQARLISVRESTLGDLLRKHPRTSGRSRPTDSGSGSLLESFAEVGHALTPPRLKNGDGFDRVDCSEKVSRGHNLSLVLFKGMLDSRFFSGTTPFFQELAQAPSPPTFLLITGITVYVDRSTIPQ